MHHNLCDACETVVHCSKHGCVPLQQLAHAEAHHDSKGYELGNQRDYETFAQQRNMNKIKSSHQAAYDYAMATLKQSAGEIMLDKALRTLGSDNHVIDLCEPILVAYRGLLTQTIGLEMMDWLDWWMYETDYGTKYMEFEVNGTSYDPTTMTLYHFLELVDDR